MAHNNGGRCHGGSGFSNGGSFLYKGGKVTGVPTPRPTSRPAPIPKSNGGKK